MTGYKKNTQVYINDGYAREYMVECKVLHGSGTLC